MDEKRLNALISLLDDPDESVFRYVLDEFVADDLEVVEQLEQIGETSLDPIVQQRIDLIVKQLHLRNSKKQIRQWANQPKLDLFEGYFLISKIEYPEIKEKIIQLQIEKIKKDIWLEFRNSLTSLEKITILNYIFFDYHQFAVNFDSPPNPWHCYLNKVLESHQGNGVAIAILYLLIARSLNLPVHYIDIPRYPLIGYFDKDIALLAHGDVGFKPILFYINPFNKGAIIGPKEIEYIQHPVDQEKLTEACPDKVVIERLIQTIAEAHQSLGHIEKESYWNEILSLFQS